MLAFVANALGWLNHRQWHRSLLGNWWTANLIYVGLALMVGASIWDFVSPAKRG